MKEPSEALFHLIHNMSDEDKKFFKRFALINQRKQSNLALELFNAISASKKYDEKILKQKFGKQNFRQLKNQLKNKVLDSLCLTSQNTGFQLRRKLNHAELLADYGVPDEAQHTLSQIIKKIDINVAPGGRAELHLALSQKSALLQRSNNINLHRSVDSLGEDIIRNVDSLAFSVTLYYHYLRVARIRNINVNLRSDKQKEDFSQVKKFFSIMKEKPTQAFDQNLYILLAKSNIAYIDGDFNQHLLIEKRIFEMFFSDPETYAKKGKDMLGNAFNNFTQACFKSVNISLLNEAIKIAEPVYNRHFIRDTHFGINFLSVKSFSDYLTNQDNKSHDNLLLYFNKHEKSLTNGIKANVLYILMLSYHKNHNWTAAKKKCRLLLEIPRRLEAATDIREFAHLFYFIICFDQIADKKNDDTDGFIRQLNSFNDKTRKQYTERQLESLFIRFFLRVINIKNKQQQQNEFQNLSVELKNLRSQNIQYVEQMFSKFDFIKWAEQK